jgi:hypothetical protein
MTESLCERTRTGFLVPLVVLRHGLTEIHVNAAIVDQNVVHLEERALTTLRLKTDCILLQYGIRKRKKNTQVALCRIR